MYIVTAEEMYEIDRYAIEKGGIAGKLLMENAGSQVAHQIKKAYDINQRIAIVVGSGNNGGDGFVIGRYLAEYGFDVTLFQLVADQKIKGDAAYHKQLFLNHSDKLEHVTESNQLKDRLIAYRLVVDAILGIGVSGEVREPIRSMIEVINQSDLTRISVDIPSGLPANDGEDVDIAVKADQTYIIEAPKVSTFCEPTSNYYGNWDIVKIGIPTSAYLEVASKRWRTTSEVQASFPNKGIYAHKGSNGRGVIIGAQPTMPGSVLLSARAALRSGAGLITVATLKENIPIIANGCVEATYHVLPNLMDRLSEKDLKAFEQFDAIAVGMGMGRARSELLSSIIENLDKPVLIDADGLYHLKTFLDKKAEKRATIIITPHYGEMAMLSNLSVSDIKKAPFEVSKQFAIKHKLYIVLKGKNTIITTPNGTQIVSNQGNPGLAKGGTGDVLSGILLTMIMQHPTILDGLANGAYVHGMAADLLIDQKQHTEIDLLATDVIEGLSQVFRTFS
ncbi:bifunctional ADP-dependent NAD(P)H-hydrate dehydratase/NAD(P)H-hydrate epimerase [Gracilibacillus massiliensis]|uniref:bifunctional ADP-dependent NAD(P)H-hydrate dehydratase/NAD(P)H-hydrate epimerase n=1 Tax=Gracilibacillus massiliensis TaxID=1564956 RepID=UPI00071D5425|nr:bifunctional ADP-dependent NAD(P)H-hydrate dehydratase/NAD(P)H-hydrate epimerase [Gracilibacillus massiliensis]